jgi:hypothetical protein
MKRLLLNSVLAANRGVLPAPRFPVELTGFRELHAPFLKERRTHRLVQGAVREIRGISLVFGEMWDTTDAESTVLAVRDGVGKVARPCPATQGMTAGAPISRTHCLFPTRGPQGVSVAIV